MGFADHALMLLLDAGGLCLCPLDGFGNRHVPRVRRGGGWHAYAARSAVDLRGRCDVVVCRWFFRRMWQLPINATMMLKNK